MNQLKPRYIGGLAILFWGFQCDLLPFAIAMAFLSEARYFTKIRWALTKKDFYQIADLSSIVFVLVVFFLILNRREYHLITTLLAWIPILIYPLVISVGYSTTPRMTLDVLFYSLRRQKEPIIQSWDMDYVLLGACVLAAGLNRDNPFYFPIAALVLALALFQLRSTRWENIIFISSMMMVLLSATALQHAIRSTHIGIKEKSEQLIARWIARRTDPFKTRTAIGRVGQLKFSDAIAFRIEPLSSQPDFPPLIQEATYNSPALADWEVFDLRFQINEKADDYRWEFPSHALSEDRSAKIYIEFDRESAIIPVPAELTQVSELPAKLLKKSSNGTIKATGLMPAPHYIVNYRDIGHLGSEPTSIDLHVPNEYRTFLQEIVPHGLQPMEALIFVKNYFKNFRYTLYQPDEEMNGNPLIYFMLNRRAGHCEYFASATAMMLRELGIPSRYVVGYAIQEWNEDLSMYIVRERHAHAWTIAYVDNKWVAVDTTPSEWIAIEENEASSLQPLSDFLSNNLFLLSRWWNAQDLEDYEEELYIIGVLLTILLIWRVTKAEQVNVIDSSEENLQARIMLGRESPFFQIEKQLMIKGYHRYPGELMAKWLIRIQCQELLPLLSTHNRWRFDPRGISLAEKRRLLEQVQTWLNEDSRSSPDKP